jgi:hypothetical protein
VSATRSTTVSLDACPSELSRPRAASTTASTAARSRSPAARSSCRVAPAGHQLGVGEAQRIAGGKQLVDGATLAANELVDRPRGHRRLAQPGDLLGLLASPFAAQRLGQRTACVDEAGEGEAVEIIDVHAESRACGEAATEAVGAAQNVPRTAELGNGRARCRDSRSH